MLTHFDESLVGGWSYCVGPQCDCLSTKLRPMCLYDLIYRTSVRCDFALDVLRFLVGAHYHTWQHVYVVKLRVVYFND